MCKLSSKSGGVPFQPLGDLTWNDPLSKIVTWVNYYAFQLYYSETDDSYAHDSEEEVRLHYPPHHPSTGSTPSTTPASSTPYSTPQSMSPPPVQGNVRHRKTSHEVLPTQRMIHR